MPLAPAHVLGMSAIHGEPWCIVDLARLLPDWPPLRAGGGQGFWVLFRRPRMRVGFVAERVLGMEAGAPQGQAQGAFLGYWGEDRVPVVHVDALLG